MRKILLFATLCLTATAFAQKFEGLALTPPMGWNSWNTFASNIDEQLVRGMADTMIANGMRDALLTQPAGLAGADEHLACDRTGAFGALAQHLVDIIAVGNQFGAARAGRCEASPVVFEQRLLE